MNKMFYETLLPSQGVYCATAIDNRGRASNHFAENIDQLTAIIAKLKSQDLNSFVAPNSFKTSGSRTSENALFSRSFFIDLDVGVGTKKYPDQASALDALIQFIDKKELPPPMIINSGGGIHAYWAFDRDVPITEWRPYARLFKALCLENIKIDPAITADAARIMRCPDSFNYKTSPPKPTSFINQEFNQYSFDMFKQFLGKPEPELEDILAGIEKGLDEDTAKLAQYNNFDSVFSEIVVKSLAGTGCNQIKNIIENAATLSEPLWYAGLSIARACTDWETAIHLMSEDHPGYDKEKTIAKAQQTFDEKKNKAKPQSCEHFKALNPEGCSGCPHKIVNPCMLGRVLKVADTTTDAEWKGINGHEIPKFPEGLKPYVRGANGGIYFIPVSTDEADPDPAVNIFKYDLFPLKRMYNKQDGDFLLMRCVLPHDNNRDFILPMSNVQSPEALKSLLPRYGATFNNLYINHVMTYLRKWSEYMTEAKIAEQMRMQMGWTEEKDAFVIGNTEITPDGAERTAPSSPYTNNIARLLRPVGDYAAWKKAFNSLNMPGFELHAFGGLIGFGSILMNLTSTSGSVVCFSGESGVAKTGSLYACLSVWGQPKELSVFDSTDNGMVGRYLSLHNLPLGCDEVSNKKPEQLSNLIHKISHGKAKIRMQASVNAEREYEYFASLIALMTTNQPITDKLVQLKGSPDGEMARLIEMTMLRPESMTGAMGKEIFDAFRYNYGWAGHDFIRHYYKVGEPIIISMIEKWATRFLEGFGNHVAYRFYENTISSVFAAAELANDAGIISLDLDRIFDVTIKAFCGARDYGPVNKVDYKSYIGDFVHRNERNFLVLDKTRVVQEPYGPLVGRTEIHNQMRYISATEMRKFLNEFQVSIRTFTKVLQTDGMLAYLGKQRLSNGWKSGQSTPPISVFGFKMDKDDVALTATPTDS